MSNFSQQKGGDKNDKGYSVGDYYSHPVLRNGGGVDGNFANNPIASGVQRQFVSADYLFLLTVIVYRVETDFFLV